MDPRTDHLKGHPHIAVNLEDAIQLLRPHDLVGRHPPGKAADPAEQLALREERLTASQRLLRPFALVNVNEQVVPADDVPVRIPKRESAGLKPAVDAIETPSAHFELEGVA